MSELERVAEGIELAACEQRVIDDTTARIIAGWWHGGQVTALCSFASCGAIDSRAVFEAEACIPEAETYADRADLRALVAYFEEHGERGPRDAWNEKTGY